jgi:ATP-dependent HslUV protease ATP-binding subunit HslU
LVEKEKTEEVKQQAEILAIDRIIDALHPRKSDRAQRRHSSGAKPQDSFVTALNQLFSMQSPQASPSPPDPAQEQESPDNEEEERKRREQDKRVRELLRHQIESGLKDEEVIEIEVEEAIPMPFMQVIGPQGMDDPGGSDMQNMLGPMMPKRHKKKKLTIGEAREYFIAEEARGLIDQDQLTKDAITRAEQSGIIFVDEMDKIAGRNGPGGHGGPDVSREGVQRDILPIIEGSTVQTKHGPVKTDYILFIAAGAFHLSKPSDLIPELQGRLPIRVELDSLTVADFRRILTEPRNALIKQYIALLATEGVTIVFTDDAVEEIASIAAEINQQMENIGARRLHTVMERLLDELSYDAPDVISPNVTINANYVREKLENIVKNEDLSRYIL